MSEKNIEKNFFMLSVASILVKILSAIYIPILRSIIGIEAYGIYGATYSILIFILAISSMGTQPAITKVVSEYLAVENRDKAVRTLQISKKYLSLIGLILTISFMLLAKPIGIILKWEQATQAMIVLSPTIFFTCILSAYRGYLQGIQEMKFIAISQVIEQSVNIVTSIIFAKILIEVSMEFGVAGATIGSSLGAIVSIIIIIFYNKGFKRDLIKSPEDKQILKNLIKYCIPSTIVIILQNASSLVDTFIVKKRLISIGFSNTEANFNFGILNSYNTIIYVPLAIVTALSTVIFPKIITTFIENKKKKLEEYIELIYKLTLMISIPSSIGLAILSKEIYIFLFGDIYGYKLMLYGSILIVFMSITTIQNTIIQATNRFKFILYVSFLGLILKVIFNFSLIGIKKINIYGAIIATIISLFAQSILNHKEIEKIFNVKIQLIKLAVPIIISSSIMGGILFILKHIFNKFLSVILVSRLSIMIEILILILLGVSVYLIMMIKSGEITQNYINEINPFKYKVIKNIK